MRKLNMPRRLSSSAARTHGGNMLFMLPTIILFCIVVLIPFFQGIPYSFTNWKSIVSETTVSYTHLTLPTKLEV